MGKILDILFTFCVISLFTINDINAQCTQGAVTTFQKVFGGNGNERGHSVIQTNDGGYVVVGETTSFGAGGKDFFVTKLSQTGVIQWTKTYGGSSDEDGSNIGIIQSSDGGYMLYGYTESFGAGSNYDSYVLKLDVTGNIQWEKRVNGTESEALRDVWELPSGEFVFVGNSNSLSAGSDHDFHVVKISSIGNIIWSKTYGGTGYDQAVGMTVDTGGNIYVSGVTDSYGIGTLDGFILKLDGNGIVVWQKSVGGSSFDGLYNTIVLNDGNILTTCLTEFGSGARDILVVKLDATTGNLIWTKAYGGVQEDYGINLQQKSNNEIIISANTLSFGNGQEMLLFSIDSVGSVNWAKIYGGGLTDEFERWGLPMILTPDGGMMLVGTTESFGAIAQDVYIIKTNSCSESFCNEQVISLTTTNPPTVVLNTNVTVLNGLSLVNTNTIVNIVNFTENYQCIDIAIINIGCNLVANFSSTSFCLGDSTFFIDLSIDSVGAIVNWQWYFGDGDSIVGVQNPSHLYNNAGNFNVVLAVTNDSNCIDSITMPITINPIFSINQNVSICANDSILLGGNFQNTAGIYMDSLQTIFGCDSIITTNLSINPTTSSSQNQTICQGDSLLFGGVFYNTSGSYTDSLQTLLGCDSLITLNLTVNPSLQFNLTQTICSGDSVFLGGSFQSSAGVYSDTLQNVLSCDSIINTTLVVGNVYNDTVTANICQGDSILLGGNFQSTAGFYTDSLQTVLGCDSVVITSLSIDTMINLIVSNDTVVSPCNTFQLLVSGGNSYLWTPSTGLSCTNCANPTVFPTETTTYTVTDLSNSCGSTNSLTISVEGESDFFIPNVFTPNRDGNNDEFNVKSTCIYSLEKKIYNRWGSLLFESTQINEAWDGRTRSGEEVPEGTYFYIIKVGMYQNNDEIVETYTGTITLMR